MKSIVTITIFLVVAGITALANNGSGTFTVASKFDDYEGNHALNRETFNTYSGLSLSLTDLNYLFRHGVVVSGNFVNVTRNDRNLRGVISKPGKFRFSILNNQYRRIYSQNGDRFTRRRNSQFKWSVTPRSRHQIFGSYGRIDKRGEAASPMAGFGTIDYRQTDYVQQEYSVGGRVTWPRGQVRTEYRRIDFEDKSPASLLDRVTDNYRIDLSSDVPRYHYINVSAGYYHRLDRLDTRELELKSRQFWLGTKLRLPAAYDVSYRLMFARTDNTGTGRETDVAINTISAGKRFSRSGGMRVGYENRIADDLVDRNVSDGFLINGWYNFAGKILVKGSVTYRSQEVKTGATLLGDEDRTRHRFSIRYLSEDLGDLTVAWVGRIRKNPDINSRADYNSYSTALNIRIRDYGHVSLSHSYYLGKFENRSEGINYEFSDHVLNATISPETYKKLTAVFGATYYRSRRDADIEKFSLSFTGAYDINKDYQVEAVYEVFNYDDFLTRGAYYTANIVEIRISRGITIK